VVMMAAAEMPAETELIPGMPAVAAIVVMAFMAMATPAPAFMEVFEKHRIISVTVSIYR